MIIRSNRKLKELYHDLGPGDIFIGMLSSKYLNQSVLVDLLERSVICLPSPLSQNLNRSKVAQALIFKAWMLPHTSVITRRMDLVDAINQYNKHGITAVLTKQESMHCGHGVRRWENIETLYNIVALSKSSYPFVLQPFINDLKDVRVIIVADYIEAYGRRNPDNFRMNISSGGKNYSYALDQEQEKFCRSVMERGKFPYAHLDLQITESGEYYLAEIALNGGIKGAGISRQELDKKKKPILEKLANPNIF
jgi:ribosomal protein S6--L-glutamate ligase